MKRFIIALVVLVASSAFFSCTKDYESHVAEIEKTLEELRNCDAELDGYIAKLEAKITSLEKEVDSLGEELAIYIESLKALQEKNKELEQAIDELEKVVADFKKYADDTYARLDEFNALKLSVETLKSEIEAELKLLRADISEILAIIQSVSFLSEYADGSVRVSIDPTGDIAPVELNYKVRPTDAAERLAESFTSNKQALQMSAYYTLTKADFEFVEMPVLDVSAKNDILTITASADNFSSEFSNGSKNVAAALLITDGKTDYMTEYANLIAFKKSFMELSENGTANCYIVSKPGKYAFKPVCGNSNISVGEIASVDVLWETFGTDIAPAVNDLIAEVKYENDVIKFMTSEEFVEGNAVICAKDADGTILWSWHIWLTDVPADQVYYNGAGSLMDRNLGATSATPGDPLTMGLFYQWGRKDPFPGASSFVDASATAAATTIEWPEIITSDAEKGTIAYTIAHPTQFLGYNNDNWDWCWKTEPDIDYRWDEEKTMYDPCPVGYRVPNANTAGVFASATGKSAMFSQSGYDSENHGRNFSGLFGDDDVIWYPNSGSKNMYNGAILQVGQRAYWYGCDGFYLMYFDSSIYPCQKQSFKSAGYNIRCQKID